MELRLFLIFLLWTRILSRPIALADKDVSQMEIGGQMEAPRLQLQWAEGGIWLGGRWSLTIGGKE